MKKMIIVFWVLCLAVCIPVSEINRYLSALILFAGFIVCSLGISYVFDKMDKADRK